MNTLEKALVGVLQERLSPPDLLDDARKRIRELALQQIADDLPKGDPLGLEEQISEDARGMDPYIVKVLVPPNANLSDPRTLAKTFRHIVRGINKLEPILADQDKVDAHQTIEIVLLQSFLEKAFAICMANPAVNEAINREYADLRNAPEKLRTKVINTLVEVLQSNG